MAGRSLGELVRKMGDRVLVHIIPILQQARHFSLLFFTATHPWACAPCSCNQDDMCKSRCAGHDLP